MAAKKKKPKAAPKRPRATRTASKKTEEPKKKRKPAARPPSAKKTGARKKTGKASDSKKVDRARAPEGRSPSERAQPSPKPRPARSPTRRAGASAKGAEKPPKAAKAPKLTRDEKRAREREHARAVAHAEAEAAREQLLTPIAPLPPFDQSKRRGKTRLPKPPKKFERFDPTKFPIGQATADARKAHREAKKQETKNYQRREAAYAKRRAKEIAKDRGTRSKKEIAKIERRVAAGRLGRRRQYLEHARDQVAGVRGVSGKNRDDWHVLRAKMKNKHKDWLDFVDYCDEYGFDEREIVDEWFSPDGE